MFTKRVRSIPIVLLTATLFLSISFAASTLADEPAKTKPAAQPKAAANANVPETPPPNTWVNIFWSKKGLRGKPQSYPSTGKIIQQEAKNCKIITSDWNVANPDAMDIFLPDVGGEYFAPLMRRKIVAQRAWLNHSGPNSRPIPAAEFIVFELGDDPDQIQKDFKEYLLRTANPPPPSAQAVPIEWIPPHRLAASGR